MSNVITIFHNPNCSKSRKTLELLRERKANTLVKFYLDEPPSLSLLASICDMLGMSPRELLRTGEDAYKEQGLENEDLSDLDILKIMIEHPILIERPIVVGNHRACIGRPPENALELLDAPPPADVLTNS